MAILRNKCYDWTTFTDEKKRKFGAFKSLAQGHLWVWPNISLRPLCSPAPLRKLFTLEGTPKAKSPGQELRSRPRRTAALPRTKDTAKTYPFVWDKLLSRSLFCRPWCPRELCLHPCPFPRVPFFGATPAERALEGTWHTALHRQSQLEVTLLEEKRSFWIEHFFFFNRCSERITKLWK